MQMNKNVCWISSHVLLEQLQNIVLSQVYFIYKERLLISLLQSHFINIIIKNSNRLKIKSKQYVILKYLVLLQDFLYAVH